MSPERQRPINCAAITRLADLRERHTHTHTHTHIRTVLWHYRAHLSLTLAKLQVFFARN